MKIKKDFSPTVKKLKDVPMDNIENTVQFENYVSADWSGGYVELVPPFGAKVTKTLTSSDTYTLPADYPASSGLALVSTDAGVMSWSTSGEITGVSGGSDNRLTYWAGATTLQGTSAITITSDTGITMSGTLQAEHVHSTDDISVAAPFKEVAAISISSPSIKSLKEF